MQLIPAIDVRAGRTVRLLQGRFDAETVYPIAPEEIASRYADWGAEWIHVVDLDGARSGDKHSTTFRDALASVVTLAHERDVRLQTGGGMRTAESIERTLAAGVARVVLGSAAVDAPEETARWMERFGPERIVLAFDVRTEGAEPYVVTHGWERITELSLWSAIEGFTAAGLRHVLCTDVSRDGALSGPNIALYRECVERYPGIEFQASGGVASVADLRELAQTGVASAISGKALLEERITPDEAKPFLPRG